MPPNHFESEVESFLEGSHGDRTHIKRADHHTVTPLCGTLLFWDILSTQGELFRAQPHHRRCMERRRVQTAWPRCPWAAPGHCHSPPTGTRTTPEHDIIRPTTTTRGHFRYKTLPAHPPSPHVRYKTLPARATRPHFRYKTLPARPKWLNLALFLHAGRVLYRCHHQEAEQGEFCTERAAEIEQANTTHQAPPVWKTPEGPEGPAAMQAPGWQGQHGFAGPAPNKFRMQFDWTKFQQTQKTLQFQRCKFNV